MSASAETAPAPHIVNGIDIDALQELAGGIAGDSAKGQTKWRVASAWQGQTHSRATVESFHMAGEEVRREFSIDIDEPSELGGGNAHANPQEYLIAALNACMIVGYTALCALEGITLESLEIETEGEIDLRGFLGLDPNVSPGYDSLSYTVRIKGDGSREQFAKIHETVMATSPNYHNISRAVSLKPVLVVE